MTEPPPPRPARDGPHPGYRANVGLMVLDRRGAIFLGRRHGATHDHWQMPQGGIEAGESATDAAWRELLEEIGTRRATLLGESRYWYAYRLPPAMIPPSWPAGVRGQSQRWFAFRFTGIDADIDIDGDQPEFAAWRWARVDETLRLVVPFKRPVYQAVLAEFAAWVPPPQG